jgi:hypothetical protein
MDPASGQHFGPFEPRAQTSPGLQQKSPQHSSWIGARNATARILVKSMATFLTTLGTPILRPALPIGITAVGINVFTFVVFEPSAEPVVVVTIVVGASLAAFTLVVDILESTPFVTSLGAHPYTFSSPEFPSAH